MNLKKALTLIGLILVTAAIGFALYMVFFRVPPEELPPEVPPEVPIPAPLPPAVPGVPTVPGPPEEAVLPPTVSAIADGGPTAVTPVTNLPTRGASLSPSGDLNYYNLIDGKFYRINTDGTVTSLSNKVFHNVDNATFDPSGNKAIIEYPDGANILFDFTTNQQVTLPRHWESFDFDPQGQQIAAKSIGLDEENRWMVVSNPDGSAARPIQELGVNADKVTVDWSPNNQILGIAETGDWSGPERREIFFIGQHNENFRSLVVEGLNFESQWSPTGQQLMYSTAASISDYKPSLWIVDAAGDDIGLNRRRLNVDTWSHKCTFADTQTLYCAVPRELPTGAGLQPAVAADIPDDIYKIDMRTGLQTRVAIPEGDHTVDSIMLTPDNSYLFFTDQDDGTLNKIQLK
ncbi:hypothetical protein AMJ57_02815 [Parcubacteria bacterium SG8_24]|nr:MAG: hypothetical protein AMJ57_02815 [Parcubacteria bacterium SG8_24]